MPIVVVVTASIQFLLWRDEKKAARERNAAPLEDQSPVDSELEVGDSDDKGTGVSRVKNVSSD